MKVDTRVVGLRNMLRALENAKIDWDEVGCGLAKVLAKIGEHG